jgi:hypothetical protein
VFCNLLSYKEKIAQPILECETEREYLSGFFLPIVNCTSGNKEV